MVVGFQPPPLPSAAGMGQDDRFLVVPHPISGSGGFTVGLGAVIGFRPSPSPRTARRGKMAGFRLSPLLNLSSSVV